MGSQIDPGPFEPRFRNPTPKKTSKRRPGGLRAPTSALAGGRCQAAGLHHRDCPGHQLRGHRLTDGTLGAFSAHHVIPKGTQFGGTDDQDNLLWVWNGASRLGRGGCHGMIHDLFSKTARVLGLLRNGADDPWFDIGIEQAIFEMFLLPEDLDRLARAQAAVSL